MIRLIALSVLLFAAPALSLGGGIEAVLRGLATQNGQEIDRHIVGRIGYQQVVVGEAVTVVRFGQGQQRPVVSAGTSVQE